MRWNGHLTLISLPTFAVLPVSFSHCGYVADSQKVRILSPCVFHFHICPFASFSNILKSIPFIFTSLDPRSDFNKSTLAAHVKIQAAPIIFELHAHLHVDGAQLHVRPSCVHAWHMLPFSCVVVSTATPFHYLQFPYRLTHLLIHFFQFYPIYLDDWPGNATL